MLYDRDICEFEVKDDRLCIYYYAPTGQGIFTREDLVFLLKHMDDNKVCKHENIDQYSINDVGMQVVWVYTECLDCQYTERLPVHKDLSVGDKEILSGERQ